MLNPLSRHAQFGTHSWIIDNAEESLQYPPNTKGKDELLSHFIPLIGGQRVQELEGDPKYPESHTQSSKKLDRDCEVVELFGQSKQNDDPF
jgi:hypothetical protein